MKANYKLTVAVLAGVALGSGVVKADICSTWAPDKDMNEKAHELAFLLLKGDLDYTLQVQKVFVQVQKGPDPEKNRAELVVDLHCQDPEDVSLDATGKLNIDTWRVRSTASLVLLRNHKGDDAIKTELEKDIQEYFNVSHPESKDIFVADFNRRAEKSGLTYEAHKDTIGNIKFDAVERAQPPVSDQK
jgi:hypothetical protein